MTYPDDVTGLRSLGLFTEDSADAAKFRERLVAIGSQWFQQCKQERIRQERQWMLNLAFYSGRQHVRFKETASGSNFDLYTPQAPYYVVRIVINQIRKIVRKEISRLTAQKPNAYVIPSTTEDADVFAAQAGEQIWDSLWRRLKFNKTLREAIFNQAVYGNGFIKSYWDPSKTDPGYEQLVDPSMPNMPTMPNDASELFMQQVPSGDICIESINPFHIFVPDLLALDIEDQPYVIHAQIKNNSWIKQNLGVDPSGNSGESVDEQMQTILGVNRNDNKKDQTIILEIWVKPGYIPELKNGGMFTLVGDQIIQGFDKYPYDHGQYPFTKLDAMMSGKFYNTSIVEDLIPLQRELNRSRAQLIESKNKMSKPQLMAERGSVDARKITTEPGQLIEYSPGFNPPTPLSLQNLPSYVTEEINRLYDDLSDLSGQHEVSNGSTPPGVTAATAISFLQEQDESLIAPQFTSVEEAIEKIAAQCLYYVKMYWDEKRTIKIVGVEGTFDVQTFQGTDLRGNTDIRVESGSSLPTSRAAKQAFLMDLMKMGFIPADKGLELMEIGGLNRLYEQLQVDKRQAQRENAKMRVVTEEDVQQQVATWQQANPSATTDPNTGMPLSPPLIVATNTWDNHALHIEAHNNYRKSQSFESADPVVKALFEAHVQQHMEAIANTMDHPLTGMDSGDPNAPDPSTEQQDATQQPPNLGGQPSDSTDNPTGPTPMPDLQSDGGGG